jgi:hypothetical protein
MRFYGLPPPSRMSGNLPSVPDSEIQLDSYPTFLQRGNTESLCGYTAVIWHVAGAVFP